MQLIDKLSSNNTSKIGIFPNASKYVSNKVSDQCKYILNNKERLNILKGSTKMQNKESIFKCKSHIYNVKRKYGFIIEVLK